jgi:hypothetical protein
MAQAFFAAASDAAWCQRESSRTTFGTPTRGSTDVTGS